MRFRDLLAATIAAVGLVGAARADSVDAKFLTVTNGGIILSVSAPGLSTVAGYVGQYNWVTLDSSRLGPTSTSFYTFCIELNQDINFNTSYTYDLMDPSGAPRPGAPVPGPGGMGAANALRVDELWGQHIGDVIHASDAGTELIDAAAFQVAVWKIIYGDGVTTTGDSRAGSINTLAQTWVSGLDPNGAMANVIALSSDGPNGAQDQITALAPLPATAWAGLTLLAGLGVLRFRRSQHGVCRA